MGRRRVSSAERMNQKDYGLGNERQSRGGSLQEPCQASYALQGGDDHLKQKHFKTQASGVPSETAEPGHPTGKSTKQTSSACAQRNFQLASQCSTLHK